MVLISTYDLGRQPFGLASPAAWLRAAGHEVTMADVSCSPMPRVAVEQADLIAFFLPMHTATQLALRLMDRVKHVNPGAHLCAFGLYAPLNERLLRGAGVGTILGGEFESGLVELASGRDPLGRAAGAARLISLDRQQFRVPDRTGLPPLGAYAQLVVGCTTRRVGYTEASRGCKHLCRHCPVVPVYRGTFRVVQAEVVLEDIRRQVAAGAEHTSWRLSDQARSSGNCRRQAPAIRGEECFRRHRVSFSLATTAARSWPPMRRRANRFGTFRAAGSGKLRR